MATKFIQGVFEKAKDKGTAGDCTGSKFGGPTCPEGSKKYNFAKLIHRIAHEKHMKSKKGM